MGKILIIAEKPSVATDLSRALVPVFARFEKKGKGRETWFENDQAIITSAVGHLVELRMPTGPNGKKLPWNLKVLPAIPSKFELDPSPDSQARLRLVLKLARRKDVDLIVNACDAGREGELIFRYIMDIGKIKKPIKRLWMQSMTKTAILQAWQNLRDDEQMQSLADAARCRSESDWLVGLNATRALTCFRSRHGGFNITSAGRVQTPTLAILAKREAQIQAFEPRPYREVHAAFDVAAGQYPGVWIDEQWKKDPANPHSRPERIWEPSLADAIRERCDGKQGEVAEEKRPKSMVAPQLYDLTTLQREAPFSAKGTLAIAQRLYERHKMITYPRTDSRYLTEDYMDTVRSTMEEIANGAHPAAEFARAVLRGGEGGPRLAKSRRVFDNKKVSDHFAIIPTGRMVKLSDTEQKVYDMIVRRFIAVFYPSARYEITKRLTRIRHDAQLVDTFKTDGRILVFPGWREVYGAKAGAVSGKDELVPVAPGESATAAEVEIHDEETKPPARFTESTLLSAMEGAGKLVDDEALAAAMSERGLGTPATRAAIIETLISQKYIVRDGDGGRAPLHVTGKGMHLIDLLEKMGIHGLSSPSLTGDWEYKLRRMEHGELPRAEFMREIEDYTRDIVERTRARLEAAKNEVYPDINAPCPRCHAPTLKQTDGTYQCHDSECGFKTNKYIAGRKLSEDEARQLFSTGFVGPLEGFRSRFNKPFDAALKLDEKFKAQFVFDDDDSEAVELTEEDVIGTLTLPDGRSVKVYESAKAYHVPELKTKNDPDGLRLGRKILQLEIPREQALKLIGEGKTDLLKGFISKRTKRPFSARLTLNLETGKLGFEFEPRQPRKKAAKKGK
jgi:DNA topoisomerase-3